MMCNGAFLVPESQNSIVAIRPLAKNRPFTSIMSRTWIEYLEAFKSIYKDCPPDQGKVGHRPAAYIFAAFAQDPNDDASLRNAARELLNVPLNPPFENAFSGSGLHRDEVARICRDKEVDVIVAYSVAMAWGVQWDASTYKAFEKSLENKRDLRRKLEKLRDPTTLDLKGLRPRQAAFSLFSGNEGIGGLGISYFSKLLFFFMPDGVKGYILDSRTAKAVSKLAPLPDWSLNDWRNRLTEDPKWPYPTKEPKRTTSYLEYLAKPTSWNTPDHYETYCRYLESLADQMTKYTQRIWTASHAEQALFGSAEDGTPGGRWRRCIGMRDEEAPQGR
jgi:hypothetical protein